MIIISDIVHLFLTRVLETGFVSVKRCQGEWKVYTPLDFLERARFVPWV
jgi:hypothetical protein